MIQHKITPAELRKHVLETDPDWYRKAKATFAGLPANPTSKQFKSLWSDIKSVWITLQGSKCIYCESQIEGSISNDVEHFRPKTKVSDWKPPAVLVDAGVVTTTPTTKKGDAGYRNLAYDPWNYAASCKVCNSVLKKNYFPIRGPRKSAAKNPRTMKGEKAYFVYPIGDFDDDPQKLIRFAGMLPEPATAGGTHEYHRALVMIDVFQLGNGEDRKELLQSRARLLKELYDQLRERDQFPVNTKRGKDAREWIQILVNPQAPHTNCLKSFQKIYSSKPERAAKLIDQAKTFLQTGSLVNEIMQP